MELTELIPNHDICLQDANENQRTFSIIEHQAKKIDEWVQALCQRFDAPIAIVVELSKGPIIYALQKYDCFAIFPINPSILAKYRQAFQPSRANNNPTMQR